MCARSEFSAGSVIQRFPGRRHRLTFFRGHQLFQTSLGLPAEIFQLFRTTQSIDLNRPVIHIGIHPSIPRMVDEFLPHLQALPDCHLTLAICRIYRIMAEMHLQKHNHHPFALAKACTLLEQAPHQREPLETVAQALSMSYSSFRKEFVRHMGIAPGQYQIRRRMERIREVLYGTNRTLKEIAEEFGYPDIYSLSRQFKKYTGQSPRGFRDRSG